VNRRSPKRTLNRNQKHREEDRTYGEWVDPILTPTVCERSLSRLEREVAVHLSLHQIRILHHSVVHQRRIVSSLR
jgi:hypothetical protein